MTTASWTLKNTPFLSILISQLISTDVPIKRYFNPFAPDAAFHYPLKTCFGNGWVKQKRILQAKH